jgi:integrase
MDSPKPDNPLAMRLDQFGLCWLELRGCCSRVVYYPLPLVAQKQGGAVRFVQDWLGHSNIQNTLVYTFLTARGREGAARKVFLNLPCY